MTAKKDDKEQEQTVQAATTKNNSDPKNDPAPTIDPVKEAEKAAEAIIAKAKKEAAEIKAKAADTAKEPTVDEDLVTIKLFKDDGRYKGDVFVAVNGRRFQIKRGVEVQVPRYVADVLQQSMDQDAATAELSEKLSEEYKQASAALGIEV